MDNSSGYNVIAYAKKKLKEPSLIKEYGFNLIWVNNSSEFVKKMEEHKPVIAFVEENLWEPSEAHLVQNVLRSKDVSYSVLFKSTNKIFSFISDEKNLPFIDLCPSQMTPENFSYYLKKAYDVLHLNTKLQRKEEREDSEIKKNISGLEKRVFDFFTLSQLGKSLLSMQDMNEICHVFLSSVYEVSDVENCSILVLEDSKEEFVLNKSIGLDETKTKGLKFVREEGLFWQVLNSGEPFHIKDSTGQQRFANILEKWNLDQLESEMWFPLIVKGVLVGVLTLGKKNKGDDYSAAEIAFLSQISSQAAVAIDSALLDRQKEKAKHTLTRKMNNLTALYDVSQALNFTQDLQKTLMLILDKSKEAVNAQKASLMLINKETQELEVKVVKGIDPLVEAKINQGEMKTTKIKMGEGVAGKVAKTKKPMLINEVGKDKTFKASKDSNVDSIICMPLIANDECVGVMNITNKLSGEKFQEEDVDFLTTLCGQAAVTIYNAQLYHLAITDGLTQLHIHRYFDQRLHDEFVRARRKGHEVSVIMSDIDHFKKFNDTYGHQVGDVVLIHSAKIFQNSVREMDITARYGGEEYVVILPETGLEEATKVAERIRKNIEEYEFPGPEEAPKLKVTVSLGVATFPSHAESESDLVKMADSAMYYSKEHGRNKVSTASQQGLVEAPQ